MALRRFMVDSHRAFKNIDTAHFYTIFSAWRLCRVCFGLGKRCGSINGGCRAAKKRRKGITMPNISTSSAPVETMATGLQKSYGGPLAVVTTLFFMWGFLTCLNDILIPHLKSIFDLNYAQTMLIQFAFFGSYFVFSIPAAKLIDWIGYQRSMVAGLLTMGLGAFLFVPAASVPSYPLFLGALIVLAAGITCLQVAANPYVNVF